ncbi:TonB-dependent receptor [Aurantivibrio plasticivorans]
MTRKRLLVCGLMSGLAAWTSVVDAGFIEPLSFQQGEWISAATSIRFRVVDDSDVKAERLAFFIGGRDVTALIRQEALDEFLYPSSDLPLPKGEQSLLVYAITQDGQWQVIAELPLNVLTRGGFETAEVRVTGDVTESSQFSSRAKGDAQPTDPDTYHHLSGNFGVSTRHTRADWEIRSNANIVSTSEREQALRFNELDNEAPKTDLSDYLVEVQKNNTLLAVGHVSYGNNPLLVSGISNRGVVARTKLLGVDVSVTSQSGQTITGYNNILGTKNYSENSIQATTFGYDLLSNNLGSLRAELSYLTAEITSDLGFNIGEVADAEKSQGYGLVVSGQSASGALRVNLSYANSRYENPNDPFLSQGDDLVESLETKDDAYSASLDWSFLQPNYETGSNSNLTLSFKQEETDPLYKSVGAFVNADTRSRVISLSGQLGHVSLQLATNESRDNLDDLDTVLTTVTKNNSINLNMPVSAFSEDPKVYLPSNVGYSLTRIHQYGDNLPVGFDPNSHIPDQFNISHNLNFNWQIGMTSIGYTFSWSDQDNRQPGRAEADFRDINHGISINTQIASTVNLGLTLGKVASNDFEQSLKRYNDTASLNLGWQMTNNLSLSGNYSYSESEDSQNFNDAENYSMQTQLSYQFTIPSFGGHSMPAQMYLRHSLNDNYSIDNQFLFESSGRNWSTHGGLSISLF